MSAFQVRAFFKTNCKVVPNLKSLRLLLSSPPHKLSLNTSHSDFLKYVIVYIGNLLIEADEIRKNSKN